MPAPDVRLFSFISSMKQVVVFELIGLVALCNGICTDCTGFRQVCCGSVCAVGFNCVGRSCRNIWIAQGVGLKLVVTTDACPGVIASARVVRRIPIVKMTWKVVVRAFAQKMTVDWVLMQV